MRTGTDLSGRSGALVESHSSVQPRILFFHFVIAGLFVFLLSGLAYRQLIKSDAYGTAGRKQSHRRTLLPGPRGEILDRNGKVLAGSRQQLSVVLRVDELQTELRSEYYKIRRNYLNSGGEMPTPSQLLQITRVGVAQRYLDQVNVILGRRERIDRNALVKHFNNELLLPFVLIDHLEAEEFARLIEHLPVKSPIELYKSSVRDFPYGSAAAHVIGRVTEEANISAGAFINEGEDLKTFKMKGTVGVTGLERRFDEILQGEPGGSIFKVTPAGYRIDPPLALRTPRPGGSLRTSLDIDLQLAADAEYSRRRGDLEGAAATGNTSGAVVAMDVNTGEVLVMSSYPSYDLNEVSPRMSNAVLAEIESTSAWTNRATSGLYLPGSTFKIVTALAGLRTGELTPRSTYFTNGTRMVGNRPFRDHDGAPVGEIDFSLAIEKSMNTYFVDYGLKIGEVAIAQEAARFGLTEPTGIELGETRLMFIGTPEWKRRTVGEGWREGDTANISFGQGYVSVTPLQMAAFMASFARGETRTTPYIVHDPARPQQRSAPIGISASDYQALVDGMVRVVTHGTAKSLQLDANRTPGLSIAGKTGTAQKLAPGGGFFEIAWFICYAPVENPQIAIAVVMEGKIPGQEAGGGTFAAPVAGAILRKWWAKKNPTGVALASGIPFR